MRKYTLIITEKPDAAKRIASALDKRGKPKKMDVRCVPYYIAKRDRDIVVVPALGHLFTVAEKKGRRSRYPVFDFKWVPRFEAEKNVGHIRKWIEAISELAKNADVFVDACDYDIEGSIIGFCVLKYACGSKENESKRMKYSTLTESELEKAYDQLLPHLDFALIEAGLTRHEVDWLYGINLTRALTAAARDWSGYYTTLSTGRVQGPTLRFLVAREKSIRTFVPTPYWHIRAQLKINGRTFEATYAKRVIETRQEAETIVEECTSKSAVVEEAGTREFSQPPPAPFDIGTLQSEAYRIFGYLPRRTLDIAQRLYLDALISYPRTSSQKLPPAIDYPTILKSLSKIAKYREFLQELLTKRELKPTQGRKDDPAHPAIYPTGNLPARMLSNPESKIFDLIVRRFMSAFGEMATKQTLKIRVNIGKYPFHFLGERIIDEGWMRFYKPFVKYADALLPRITQGQRVNIKKLILEDKFAKPLPPYNPGSLLKKMEEAEIGTKATRADIIQTLYGRKYIQGEKMTVTDLGFEVLEVLGENCPNVVSVRLTRELETRMARIQERTEKRENVIVEAIEILKPALEKIKEQNAKIGERLGNAVKNARLADRTVGTCKVCGTGKLIIVYSRKTGKRFIGCTNYFTKKCKVSFPLPQKGMARRLGRNCPECGWPMLQIQANRRRPWNLCFNSRCLSKKRNGEKKSEMRDMR